MSVSEEVLAGLAGLAENIEKLAYEAIEAESYRDQLASTFAVVEMARALKGACNGEPYPIAVSDLSDLIYEQADARMRTKKADLEGKLKRLGGGGS